MLTNAQLTAYALHSQFNAWIDSCTGPLAPMKIERFACTGNRGLDRPLPQEMLEYKRKNTNAGFPFVLRFKDSKGKDALVAATQDGQFWPMPAVPTDGMGTLARNTWAAKYLRAHLQAFAYGNPVDAQSEIDQMMASVDRILSNLQTERIK